MDSLWNWFTFLSIISLCKFFLCPFFCYSNHNWLISEYISKQRILKQNANLGKQTRYMAIVHRLEKKLCIIFFDQIIFWEKKNINLWLSFSFVVVVVAYHTNTTNTMQCLCVYVCDVKRKYKQIFLHKKKSKKKNEYQ